MATPVPPERALANADIMRQSIKELDEFIKTCKRRGPPAPSSRARHLDADPGTYVLWARPTRHGSKISPRWSGPWLVTARHSDHVYSISDLDGTNLKVVHAVRLRHFAHADVGRTADMRVVASRDTDSHFDIGEIRDHRSLGDSFMFSLTWRAAPGDISEVPGSNLMQAAPELVARYVNSRRPPDASLSRWLLLQRQAQARSSAARRSDDMARARSSRGQRPTATRGRRRQPHAPRARAAPQPPRQAHQTATDGATDVRAHGPARAHLRRQAADASRQQSQALRFGQGVEM